jgi:ABC-type transport system involved in multi-copper enzyme maturation permease subunit
MSAATATPAPLDVSGTPSISFGRLVTIELRKLVDTRASRWLLIVIGGVTLLITVAVLVFAKQDDRTFDTFLGAAGSLQGFFLPLLPIMLVTSEWGQRTALTTFTLVPSRARVIVAKLVASVIAGIVAVALAFALASIGTALGGASDPWSGVVPGDFWKFALLETLGILQGFGFALLFLNTAVAIVVFLVLPNVFSAVANLWSKMHTAAPWVDPGTAQQPLFTRGGVSGEDWAHLAVSSAIWILLPLVVGLVRVLRAEVK